MPRIRINDLQSNAPLSDREIRQITGGGDIVISGAKILAEDGLPLPKADGSIVMKGANIRQN